MAPSVRSRSAQERKFPSLYEFNSMVEQVRLRDVRLPEAITIASASRPAVEELSCTLSNEAPSGVPRKEGGLNGVMSVYSCGRSYVVTYENSYADELTQRVVVVDDDYAGRSDKEPPLIKSAETTLGNTRMTTLRWLNAKYEIRYEVYTDVSMSRDYLLEDGLKTVMRDTALNVRTGVR